VTAYKKGGKTCSQGWTQSISAYWGLSSKRKVAMAAMDEGNGNIAQALPAAGPILQYCGSLLPLPPLDQHLHGLMFGHRSVH
jgi:hypothetical protein